MEKHGNKRFTYRHRMVIIILGSAICFLSLFMTNRFVSQLRAKEKREVELWAYAMERLGTNLYHDDPLIVHIVSKTNNIPFIITNDKLRIIQTHLIPDDVVGHPDKMRSKLEELSRQNTPIPINVLNGMNYHLFYGHSQLLKLLRFFPIGQLLVIAAFVAFGFIAFRSSKQDEQNRIWIGLAKETAHQLGTPTSSLLGWVEYLRSQPVDQMAVEEMNNDLTRLLKVVNRFSKIGSETSLEPAHVNEIVGNSVMYYRTRIPKNAKLNYNGLAIAPLYAMLNEPLFEWVIENLLKNSIDALQGSGEIEVTLSAGDKNVFIDVKDSGKGMPKANFKRVFEPGYTTKTRGWGLGLSLSRRIIEDYHHGRIAVAESEVGKGTMMRITLQRHFIK